MTGNNFLQWRKRMLLKGGRKVDFDWLLDISAGVSWSKLQNIILHPERCFSLEISTEKLEFIKLKGNDFLDDKNFFNF